MSVPVRLVIPAHRVSGIQSDECRTWCAEHLERDVSGGMEESVYVLHFEDWKDAALFQRRWLSQWSRTLDPVNPQAPHEEDRRP